MKRAVFAAMTVALSVGATFVATEVVWRYRYENGWRATWATFSDSAAPFSGDLGTDSWVIADPLLGYRLNPAREGVNSRGFRGPEVNPARRPGVFRIVALGDSVSWTDDSFVALVDERLGDKVEIVRTATPGYTIHQERLLLEQRTADLEVDLVLLQYCLNDNHRFLHRFDADDNMLLTEEARRNLAPQSGVLPWLARRSYLALRLQLLLMANQPQSGPWPWSDEADVGPAWVESSWTLVADELEKIQAIAEDRGAEFAVVAAAYARQFDAKLLARDREFTLFPQRRLGEICERLGVPLLDLYPAFEAGGAELYRDTIHFNKRGDRVAADALADFLREEGLLEPIQP